MSKFKEIKNVEKLFTNGKEILNMPKVDKCKYSRVVGYTTKYYVCTKVTAKWLYISPSDCENCKYYEDEVK